MCVCSSVFVMDMYMRVMGRGVVFRSQIHKCIYEMFV